MMSGWRSDAVLRETYWACDVGSGQVMHVVSDGSTLLAPLHVCDTHEGTSEVKSIVLHDDGMGRTFDTQIAIVSRFPDRDFGVWRVAGERNKSDSAILTSGWHVAQDVKRGMAITVTVCADSLGRPTVSRLISCRIYDVCEVDQYSYQSASGAVYVMRGIQCAFLDIMAKRGWSGALVSDTESGRSVGILHGNAERNAGRAVVLLGCAPRR